MVKNKIVVCEYSKIVQNVIKSILGKIKEEIVFLTMPMMRSCLYSQWCFTYFINIP